MKTIKLCKAGPFGNVKKVDSVEIIIMDEIPSFDSLDTAEKFYTEQAKKLADALFESLPQGTLDRMFYALMGRKLKTCYYRGLTKG